MVLHLLREIDSLKQKILHVGAMVEQRVHESVLALANRDEKLARAVIEGDARIDQAEVDVEESCLKALALHQPVAIDLRFIVAVLKINNDLERIGDLAVNIAERAAFLVTRPPATLAFDFNVMAAEARDMLKKSLDALVNLSPPLAYEVCEHDDVVDALNREVYIKVQQAVVAHPDQADCLIHMLSVSRHLERIADHATNIAEDVIYMVEGEIVRHKVEHYDKQR